MKKIFTVAICALMVNTIPVACKKKENTVTSKTSTPVQPTNTAVQDTALMHVWIADSVKTDTQPTIVMTSTAPTAPHDTLTVTPSLYQNYMWYGGGGGTPIGYGSTWTTSSSGDSVFAGTRYKYAITSNKLWTYGKGSPQNVQYWYHRK